MIFALDQCWPMVVRNFPPRNWGLRAGPHVEEMFSNWVLAP